MAEPLETPPIYAKTLPEKLVRHCRVIPERAAILSLIPRGLTFCEVGVALGDFSSVVLEHCGITKFYAIDFFGLHGAPQMWNGRVGRELGNQRHIDYYKAKFRTHIDDGIMEILQGNSIDMLTRLENTSIDIFYVDSDHSYGHVKKELKIINSKIKVDGLIIVNDYIMADWLTNTKYGVVQAVHEFMISENWEMVFLALHSGMFCDVAIRRLSNK